jgi:hypothetical protein
MDASTKPEPNKQDVENRTPKPGRVNVETLNICSWIIRKDMQKI